MFSVLGMSSFLSGADWINDVGLPCAIFYGNLPCFQEIFLSSIFLSSVCGLWWTDNSTDGCFTFNASVMNSAYYSQFGRFSVGWKCLVCCVLLFIFITSRTEKNRHLSQSHRTQQMRKYHAIREIFLHQLDYIRSSQWRRGGRKERNVCIRWLYPSMWFFAWMRFVREHTHTHMARHTSISDTEAEKKTHKRLI